jgi:hypothetical protein
MSPAVFPLDRLLLGLSAAALAVYLALLAGRCRRASGPGWLGLVQSGTLVALAVDVQVALLVLLLGPDGTQDGLARGDVRLRNLLALAATAAVWSVALIWCRPWRRRQA